MTTPRQCPTCHAEYEVCLLCQERTCCECTSTYVDSQGKLSSVSQLLASGQGLEGHWAHFDCILAQSRNPS